MSMLAERKQKQKWSLNPRGKLWTEDVNKFGHKMLEKMGWSAGKGLGANEDGITEHVKVSYKNDAKGMGFKDNGEQWTKHEDNFTSLLANLGAGSEATQITLPKPEKSLEKKSQSSKARVHYHKFTRGKDLASRSEKDIANIFGRKTLERPVEPKESTVETSENGTEDKSFGVVTVKAGNMTDYFKSKLGKLGNISSSKGDYALNDRDDYDTGIGACTGFGFASVEENNTPFLANNKINFVSSQNTKTDEATTGVETNNKKRKRNDSEDWTEVVSKKKKKTKKKQMAFDNLGSDINPAEEVCYDNPCLKQTDSPQKTENNDEKAKKKKRVTFSSPITEVLNKSDDSNKTGKNKKKKKNKKVTNGIDNLGCEENAFEESNHLSVQDNGKKTKKKKKGNVNNNDNSVNVTQTKKKRKHEEVGIDNLACEEISVNEKNEEIKRYKLKKKAMEHGLVNPACEANDDLTQVPSPKKKKKKSQENGLDNLGCEENTISEDTGVQKKKNKKQKNKNSFDTSNDNISDAAKTKKIKKKKKVTEEGSAENSPKKLKKKSKSKESGIENLGCEINTVEENIASINSEIDNYQTELENEINVKKTKKGQKQNSPRQKSKKNAINNIQQNPINQQNFQKHSKFNKKPFGNESSGQAIINNEFANRNNGFGNRNNNLGKRHSFENRNNNFGNRQNNFGNRHSFENINNNFGNMQNNFEHRNFFNNHQNRFIDQRGPNNFNRSFVGPTNFNNRMFYGPNIFNNRSFNGEQCWNNFNQQGPYNFNRPFNDQNGPMKRWHPDRVDKSSLKAILKPGELKLDFKGSNLMKLVGYGVTPELINKNIRPKPEPSTETT